MIGATTSRNFTAFGFMWAYSVTRQKAQFIPTHVGVSGGIGAANARLGMAGRLRPQGRVLAMLWRRLPRSSPRTWGTAAVRFVSGEPLRFIPTCVGNRPILDACVIPKTVHPHVRGEQGLVFLAPPAINGSSPRAWGTDRVPTCWRNSPRFIPTCVGNRSRPSGGTRGTPVHPHVRGEQNSFKMDQRKCRGSSPRAWGTVRH